MSGQQMSRGAWRRNPVLPRAMTQAVPRLAGSPSWAEPEGGSKRLSGALGGAIESHLPKAVVAEPPTITPEDRISVPSGTRTDKLPCLFDTSQVFQTADSSRLRHTKKRLIL